MNEVIRAAADLQASDDCAKLALGKSGVIQYRAVLASETRVAFGHVAAGAAGALGRR